MIPLRRSLSLTVVILSGCAVMLAQSKVDVKPAKWTSAVSGGEMFDTYCSACHGTDAKGHGPAASALKIPPADLTKLAEHNGGEFPANHVMSVLGTAPGSTMAHGTTEMPVWGELFRQGWGSESMARLRLYNLTAYLETIQDPPAVMKAATERRQWRKRPSDIEPGSGSAMFNAYCASCHGVDGRGAGPAAVTLKSGVPDLTMLAKNNGGKFPASAVQMVLGWQRGTTAHGSKQMPVWGELLRASPSEEERIVMLRLSNITRYVESLQQR